MAKKKNKSSNVQKTVEAKEHKEAKNSLTSQLIPKDQNALLSIVIFVLIGLVVGALVTYGAVAMQPKDLSLVDNVDVSELSTKVASYLNDNLVVDDTVVAKIVDSNKLENGLYELGFVVEQNGEIVGEGYVYATNEHLILGTMFSLNEPINGVDNSGQTDSTIYTKSEKPVVDLFIMSFCPYGLQAVDAFDDAINLLANDTDTKLGYVIYSNYASNYGQPWEEYCLTESEEYCSMHGINELNEDVRQMCIQRDQPDKLWPYMRLLVADYQAGTVGASTIEGKWKTYAEQVGVDVAAVEQCALEDAEELLAEQVAMTTAYGVSGSPTAIINGTKYSGARTSEAFKQAICSAFNEEASVCLQELDGTAAAASGSC